MQYQAVGEDDEQSQSGTRVGDSKHLGKNGCFKTLMLTVLVVLVAVHSMQIYFMNQQVRDEV